MRAAQPGTLCAVTATRPRHVLYVKPRPSSSHARIALVHLVSDDFLQRAGISMVRVPYKGGADYLPGDDRKSGPTSCLRVKASSSRRLQRT